MNEEERYRAMQWFAAGYLAANPEDPVHGSKQENARIVADTYLDKYERGECLDCGREGVVLLDGFFCERCHYPILSNEES